MQPMLHGALKISPSVYVYGNKPSNKCYRIKQKISDAMIMLYKYENGEVSHKLLYSHVASINKRNCDDNNLSFLLAYPDATGLKTVGDKLKWYRLKHDLMQKECASVMQIDRGTYSAYEENVVDAYPLDKLQMIADYYHIDITKLLDDYNLFLLNDQGQQVRALRQEMHMTRNTFAEQYHISVDTIKNWEMNRTRMAKQSFAKLFEQISTVGL